MDVIVRNARLINRDGIYDVKIEDGIITKIAKEMHEKANNEVDAKGNLVTPPFVNVHMHLDKCFTGAWRRTARGIHKGSPDVIPAAANIKRRFTEDDIIKRARKAINESIIYGTTIIRAFADVDTIGGLTAIKSILKLKKEYEGIVDLQVVAFPQEGIIRDEGCDELLRKAIDMGADVVGGIPWYESDPESRKEHIDIVFDIAKENDKDIHMLIDDNVDPHSKNIEYLLLKTIKEGFHGRVSASHCRGALDSPDLTYARRIVRLAKKAQLNVVENPHISLIMYGRGENHPVRRGLTRVRDFLQSRVNIAIGQDDIDDPYYPFGKGDMVELAFIMAHAAHLDSPEEMRELFNMITINGAIAMRIRDYGLYVGSRGDLVVSGDKDIHEYLRRRSDRLFVIKRGKIISKNKSEYMLDLHC